MTVPEREAIALDAAAVRPEAAVPKPSGLRLDGRRLLIGAAVIAGLLAPLVVQNFTIFQLTMVMIYGLAILGLNL
ncbi:MAG: branched-chain amino acid ABC transporter permease, partial [Alphaproteobacteria bacterium]|nr:branched-chain amino acid ABC transporter permease [Alphaproteobacteria bacterium]